ncbi:MAG: capsid cement protein [Ottowia sp.]|uniref:DUF2190 family protein n=1 Tax=Ottowia sp. TaxID=1898956 RepID=UPI003C7968CF
MKNFVQRGDVITVLAPATVGSGDGVLANDLFGVASHAAASGASLELVVVGVVTLPALGTDTGAVGVKVYWDTGNSRLTTTVGTNKLVGVLAAAKGASETVATIRLNGISV